MALPPGLNTLQIAGIAADKAQSTGNHVKTAANVGLGLYLGVPTTEAALNASFLQALSALDDLRLWVGHIFESAQSHIEPEQKQLRPVGMNTSSVVGYGSNIPFANAMRQFDKWLSQDTSPAGYPEGGPFDDTVNPIAVDANGYPTVLGPATTEPYTQVAVAQFFNDGGGAHPAGVYTLLWEGTATFSCRFGGTYALVSPGMATITVASPSNGGIWVAMTSMDVANPVGNLRLILPGQLATYQTQPFNPQWLEFMAPFSWIRTMDWQRVNNSPIVNWADRRPMTSLSQAGLKGVSPELLIELSKATDKPVWVCIPHQATNDYVRQLAIFLRDGNPGAKWMVEYSNETWNSSFTQAAYVVAQGVIGGLPNTFQGGQQWYARRSVQVFGIFAEVFGQGYASQIERVLAGQHVGDESANLILPFENAYLSATVWSTAPYFGGFLCSQANWEATSALTAAQIVQEMRDQIADVEGNLVEHVIEAAAQAQARGLKYLTYEGGNHAFAEIQQTGNTTFTTLLNAADARADMEDTMLEYLEMLENNGCQGLTHYHDCQIASNFGTWGAKRALTQSPAPKYDALETWINSGMVEFAALFDADPSVRSAAYARAVARQRS